MDFVRINVIFPLMMYKQMLYKGIVPNNLIYPLMMKWFLEMESLGIPFDD